MNWLVPKIQSVGDFFFFRYIVGYLRGEIQEFGVGILESMMRWVGGAAIVLMTLWILIQGYRIVTGRSREPMMLLVMNSLRATFIVSVATSMSLFGASLHDLLTHDLKNEINYVITGEDGGPEAKIDENLKYMQFALSSIDAIDVVADPTLDSAKSRSLWMTGFGTGGPALVGGSMLLLYEVALALFIGLGPLFILCLLFDQTKQLFSRWLFYGVGTMFSMAVLAAMVSIATKMVTKIAAAFWVSTAVGQFITGDMDGINSQALQSGGVGVVLTLLIVTTPPMAAMFFQGALGTLMPYSQVTGSHGAARPVEQRQTYAPQSYAQQGYALPPAHAYTGAAPSIPYPTMPSAQAVASASPGQRAAPR